ncbi:MAG: insulinase family protein [Dehalococcoidia bacterium]|nr:insulinase family protein [Dehalococcoidia bacterium]
MFQRTVMDNELHVLTSSMPHTRSVSVGIFIGAGSRYESGEIAGVSHFLEHILFKGTKSWPTARDVSEAIEGVGGVMNASTDREMTVFWCKVARPHFERALSVLVDMMLNPLLDPAEIDKEREVVLEELRMVNDYPTNRVELLIDEALWPDQAMGRDVGGSQESVSGLTREHILDYVRQQYTPCNAVVSVAGDISHEEVVDLLNGTVESWKPATPMQWHPVVDGQTCPRVRVEQRKTDQAHLIVGLPSLPMGHPDRYALGLMNVILGEGMSSRLFLELREKQGLAYDVHSSLNLFRDCGSLTVYCGVEPRKSAQAIGAILEQLGGLQGPIPQAELDKARELSKGRMLLRMEDSRSVAMWMGAQQTLLGTVRTVDEVVEKMDAVTTDDVHRVAATVVRQEALNLAVVGPFRSDRRFRSLLKI